MSKIGYFVPEFPGQTHNFFWREIAELKKLGVTPNIISTRLPPKGIISPSWSEQAISQTSYLYPLSLTDAVFSLFRLLFSHPKKWIKCFNIITHADGLGVSGKLKLLLLLPFAIKLAKFARQQGWHHVHVHSCANALNIAMFASIFSEITYSQTLHNPIAVYGGNQKNKWQYSSFGFVITEKILTEIKTGLSGYLPENVSLAPMGCDVEKFKRTGPYRPFDSKMGELTIFSCGRLNYGKGFIYLFAAVKELISRQVKVRLLVAGEDDHGGTGYRKELEKYIAEHSLGHYITLLGSQSEESIIQHLDSCHVFVLASLAEPLGVAIMEAMSMEVPVVATNAGGVPELIEHEIDGVLVKPESSTAIAGALLNIANQPEFALQLSKNARKTILANFQSTRSAGELAKMLNLH